ncbi:MAG: YciI family protein [Actinobacteria bacterium]|nr:YciI family protein [Actinomycetota bacterium]
MRFMMLLKADATTEAGVLPTEEQLAEMGKYNEELVTASVLLAGEGLQPSSQGARVRFSGSARTVSDGPFPATNELIAGYWLFETASREEAIEWVKRCPNPLNSEAEIEIRRVYEAEDFGVEFTPELREAKSVFTCGSPRRRTGELSMSRVTRFEIHASHPETS